MHNKPQLNEAPVLVEISRGQDNEKNPIIELCHRGLIAVVSGDGQPVFAMGNDKTSIHLRSCAKPFQVLPLLKTGAFNNHAPFLPSDLALLVSSHAGTPLHTTRVEDLLLSIGLDDNALRCGIHPPQDEVSRRTLAQNKKSPSVVHNNCSGKHVAMLMACHQLKLDMSSYEDVHHPLQSLIKASIATVADVDENDIAFGIDGCSLPSWALPIKNAALMYARLAYWQDHLPTHSPAFLADAFKKIWQSVTTYPEYLAGDGRFDTELIRAGHHKIFSKTGADGMQAVAVLPSKQYPLGLGIIIKIVDGDARQYIRPLLVKQLFELLGVPFDAHVLDKFLPSFKNFRGLTTGFYSNELEKYHGRIGNSDDKGQ